MSKTWLVPVPDTAGRTIHKRDVFIQFDSSPKELVQPRIWLPSRGQKTPVSSSSTPRVYFSAIALPPLRSSSLLKHLPSEPRGVAKGLILSDSSISWTNHPTAVVSLPSRLSLEEVNSYLPSLSAPLVGSTQTIPRSFSPEPLWVCVRPGRFYDLFYGPYFPLRRSGGFFCGPVVVGTREVETSQDQLLIKAAITRRPVASCYLEREHNATQ
ncbi:hypothetical protein AVEN_74808-1 [Araneus ventricosus]|uniref:Uncharacterized protein n=1 Tax=Araneus ventricosus TaxID=182803 RepID=A0A4Y2HNU1_ARAVE|nr:hypothetical protein AVEN_74808-1 [Araneus ventricosus]